MSCFISICLLLAFVTALRCGNPPWVEWATFRRFRLAFWRARREAPLAVYPYHAFAFCPCSGGRSGLGIILNIFNVPTTIFWNPGSEYAYTWVSGHASAISFGRDWVTGKTRLVNMYRWAPQRREQSSSVSPMFLIPSASETTEKVMFSLLSVCMCVWLCIRPASQSCGRSLSKFSAWIEGSRGNFWPLTYFHTVRSKFGTVNQTKARKLLRSPTNVH